MSCTGDVEVVVVDAAALVRVVSVVATEHDDVVSPLHDPVLCASFMSTFFSFTKRPVCTARRGATMSPPKRMFVARKKSEGKVVVEGGWSAGGERKGCVGGGCGRGCIVRHL